MPNEETYHVFTTPNGSVGQVTAANIAEALGYVPYNGGGNATDNSTVNHNHYVTNSELENKDYQNEGEVDALIDVKLAAAPHFSNSDIHVTASDKSAWNAKSTVSVSNTGTSTNVVDYITVNNTQYKIGGTSTDIVFGSAEPANPQNGMIWLQPVD